MYLDAKTKFLPNKLNFTQKTFFNIKHTCMKLNLAKLEHNLLLLLLAVSMYDWPPIAHGITKYIIDTAKPEMIIITDCTIT